MPAASTPGQTMVAGIKLAIKAATAYKARNEADATEAQLISNLLSDCLLHAEQLDDLAETLDRVLRLRAAQAELNAATRAGIGPDTQLTP